MRDELDVMSDQQRIRAAALAPRDCAYKSLPSSLAARFALMPSSHASVAVVTGGGRGIGRACARALANTGMTVVAVARTAEQLERTRALVQADGGTAEAFRADVTSPEEVGALAEWIGGRYEAVDLLVNNAGVLGPVEPFASSDASDWWRAVEVNLHAAVLCTRAFLPAMLAAGRGRVVNMTSGQGNQAKPNRSAYAVSKAALTRLTECLASDHPDRGVSFFALAPGPTPTAMLATAERGDRALAGATPVAANTHTMPDVPLNHAAIRILLAFAGGRLDVLSGRLLTAGDDIDALVTRADEIRKEGLYTLRLKR
jgi:NAD(P)-dependent dehydrogenase (short-subunit alcohol dehydrogenase family)